MESLQPIKGVASYSGQFTTVQIALIAAVCAVIASALTKTYCISLLYILGLCVSFQVVKYLLVQAEYLHSEWILKIVRGVKLTKLFIRSITKEVDVKKQSEPTWEELIHFSVPHAEAQALIHCITRDFIVSWYSRVSTDELGPDELEESLELACNEIFLRIQTIDKYKLTEWAIQFFREHIVRYQRAADKLKQQPKYRRKKGTASAGEFTKLKTIEQAFDAIGAFHPAVRNAETEMANLLMAMRVVLVVLLPKPARNCEAVVEALSQILARSILLSLMDLMCDPYWIHKTVIRLVSTEEVEFVDPCLKARADAKRAKPDSDLKDASFEYEHDGSEGVASEQDLERDHDDSETLMPKMQDVLANKEWSQSLDVPSLPVMLKSAHSLPAHLDETVATEAVAPPVITRDNISSHSIAIVGRSKSETPSVQPTFFVSDPGDIAEGMSTCSEQHARDAPVCPTQVGGRFSPDGESLSAVHVQSSIMQDSIVTTHLDYAGKLGAVDLLQVPGSGSCQSADSAEDASSVSSFETDERPLFRTEESEDGDDEEEEYEVVGSSNSQRQDEPPAATDDDAPTTPLLSTTDAKDMRSKHLQSPTHIFLAITINRTETARDRGGGRYTLYLIEVLCQCLLF